MKIAFLLSPQTAVSGMSNGILKQAKMWACGLRALGHEVDFVGIKFDGSMARLRDYDIVHFFQHGHWLKAFPASVQVKQPWFFSPILDSTASVGLYGLLGKLPLDHYLFSFGPRVLRDFSNRTMVSVRSQHERVYIEAVAPKASIVDHPISVTLSDGEIDKPKISIPEHFALFVGNVAAERKNVLRLIEACDAVDIPLVLGGIMVDGGCMSAIRRLIDKVSIPVVCAGFLETSELRWLYQKCSVFCLPSLVEGVGQVAMEALYFGAPVVVTKVGGAPDYFGDFAQYVNPHSVESISSAIRVALNQSVDLSSARQYLEQFSIENTSRRLLASYECVTA